VPTTLRASRMTHRRKHDPPAPFVIAVLTAMLIGSSCGPEASEIVLVPDSVLVEVLVDLHLSRARVDLGFSREDPEVLDSVLTAHDVARHRFTESLDYYSDHPEEYFQIYNRVIEVLAIENTGLSDDAGN